MSFALAGVFGVLALLAPVGETTLVWSLVKTVAEINLILGAFNLIPALPMDGGRIFRALVAMTGRRERATRIAARVGQVIALGMGVVGLVIGHVWLILIAFFVFFAAEREWQVDEAVQRFHAIPAWQAMLRPVATAGRMTTVGSLAAYAAEHEQQDFPVVEGRRIVGLVTRWDLMRALVEGKRDEPVFNVMTREVPVISPFDTLDRLITQSIPINRLVLPVVHDAKVVGLLTPNN
ncbi:MAG: site-2 protease family protein [Deltaproteobacteria bacterium]|nr:site-2 protease family protein [Deltaproteobacteria bacterium]